MTSPLETARSLEWFGFVTAGGASVMHRYCPICQRSPTDGHASDCSFPAMVKALEDAEWRSPESLPHAPTDETWRILAYCPGGDDFPSTLPIQELWRNQAYEEAEWVWSTPCWAGRGLIVLP